MRISDWSSDVCSSDLTGFDDMRVAKNEAGLCEAVIRLLEADVGACRHDVRFPEVDGIGPPVECRFGLGQRRYAIEHTLLEPFANHIRTGAEFAELVRPVEADVDEVGRAHV